MKTKLVIILAIAACCILISGCVEEPVGIINAPVEILIGDMPTDEFKHINITFSEIKLHKSGNNSGWVNITSEPKTVDLLYLHINNLNESLGIEEIEIGNYTKLWIVIDNATGVLNETNETINFTIPSNTLKIQQLFKVQEGNNSIFVDIDLNSSILKYGGGEEYKLLPVISRLSHRHEKQWKLQEHNKSKIKNMTENRPPVIDIEVNGSRGKHVTVYVGENITFNASGTYDVDGNELNFTWDFDDETNGTGPIVTHNYTDKETYHVTLIVSDGELEDTERITVTVREQGE